MGNKTSPRALRVGIYQDHDVCWYASKKNFASILYEDMKIREYYKKKMKHAKITRIEINRTRVFVEIKITCVKPSVIIGRKGVEINNVSNEISEIASKEVRMKVFAVKKPEVNAACLAMDVSNELKRRGNSARRAMKRYVQNAMRNGALGIRIECSGRLAGAEIARTEWLQDGAVPRQKFKADIDYASETAFCAWGTCGVKVWLYKGDKLEKRSNERVKNA